jgi:hypothetical protein
MSSFGSWRFTAILGTVAILGTAGVLSWALVTVSDLKSEPSERAAAPALPPSNEQSAGFAAALASAPSEPGLSGWNGDLDWLSKKSMSTQTFVAPQTLGDTAKPFWQAKAPDLPLPTPRATQSEPEGRQAQTAVPQPPVEHNVEHQAEHQGAAEPHRRAQHDPKPEPVVAAAAKAQPPKPHRVAARPSYVEKVVEQGDAGEVKFHYRRQVCGPRHMVDVCYMPPENRRSIVVERW